MTKSNITQYDNTADNNTDIQDVPLGENQMFPAHVNNAFREIMADLADINDGTVSLTSPSFAAASLTGDLSFGDNNKAIFGAGSDLQIYHDGSNSYVQDAGTGGLYLRGSSEIALRSATNENIFLGLADGSAYVYHNGSAKLATTSTGINVTGKVSSDGLEVDLSSSGNVELTGAVNSNAGLVVRDPTATAYGAHFSYDDANTVVSIGGKTNGTKNTAISIGRDSNNISFYEDTGTTPKLTWDASEEDLKFADDSKALFGAGNDLQIYHNGSDSVIQDVGQGDLYIKASNNLWFQGNTSNDVLARFQDNAAVTLYYDNSAKFATTSGGINVTGTVTADGLTVNNVFSFDNSGFNGEIKTYGSGTGIIYDALNGYHTFRENGTARMQIRAGGDIYLGYEDTGTTPKLFWDASAERLGLGTSSPAVALHAQSSTAQSGRALRLAYDGTYYFDIEQLGAGGVAYNAVSASSGGHRFELDGTERMRIAYNGNVGIGTSSPSYQTHIKGSGSAFRLGLESDGLLVGQAFITDNSGSPVYASISSGLGNLTFAADSGNSYASSYMDFQIDGSEKARLTSDGRLGLGTSSPSSLIHASGLNAELRLQHTGNSYYQRIFTDSSNNLKFGTGANGTERLRITSAGLVGIGTSSPAGFLEINGGTGVATSGGTLIVRQDGDANTDGIALTSSNAISHRIWKNSSGVLNIGPSTLPSALVQDLSGNIGIGVTSPAAKIDVVSSSANLGRFTATNGYIDLVDPAVTGRLQVSGNVFYMGTTASGDMLAFKTGANTERMRIDSSGNVGIGTTSPDSNLHVKGTTDLLSLEGTYASDRSATTQLSFRDNANVTGAIYTEYDGTQVSMRFGSLYNSGYNTNTRMIIRGNGNVGIGTSSPTTALDFGSDFYNGTPSTLSQLINKVSLYADGSGPKYGLGISDGALNITAGANGDIRLHTNGANERVRIDSSGRLQVGTTSAINDGVISALGSGRQAITAKVTNNANSIFQGFNSSGTAVIQAIGNGNLYLKAPTGNHTLQLEASVGSSTINFVTGNGTVNTKIRSGLGGTANLQFETAGSERARLDSSGNLLVGTTNPDVANSSSVEGIAIRGGSNFLGIARSGASVAKFNRQSNDGAIVAFAKDGTTVGSIGVNSSTKLTVGAGDAALRFDPDNNSLRPHNVSTNGSTDNLLNLGTSSNRFKDIYATNGTIQTSDQNEKQDIEALSEAEQRVAVAAKGLLRKFRWIDSVEEKVMTLVFISVLSHRICKRHLRPKVWTLDAMQCLSALLGLMRKLVRNALVWVFVTINYWHLLLPLFNGANYGNLDYRKLGT